MYVFMQARRRKKHGVGTFWLVLQSRGSQPCRFRQGELPMVKRQELGQS
jgi:hypothetical protein